MNHVLRIRLMVLGLLATLLAMLVLGIQLPASQERNEALRIEKQEARELQPLTAAEIQQLTTALQGDNGVRRSLVGSQRVRTIFVEQYEEEKDAPTS
jgi:hypothetical protein